MSRKSDECNTRNNSTLRVWDRHFPLLKLLERERKKKKEKRVVRLKSMKMKI